MAYIVFICYKYLNNFTGGCITVLEYSSFYSHILLQFGRNKRKNDYTYNYTVCIYITGKEADKNQIWGTKLIASAADFKLHVFPG